ncbi:MAG: LLM class flavin-dependent oxidoreductase [Betaproteobacteria bacterium]|nr:LLM class flavin-dependent oxidoreductase [Betaproteobacteria bacterium]
MLNFSPVEPGRTPRQMLNDTIEMGVILDRLGYSRYWLAEHHAWFGDGSPELLLPMIGERTQSIRVGMAGVLLYFYSPHKVAENFALLNTLFAGRVDLGVCRGWAYEETAHALLDGRPALRDIEEFETRVERMLGYLQTRVEEADHPQSWLLGSGKNTMLSAAKYGVSYCHSIFHPGAYRQPAIFEWYREACVEQGAEPGQVALAVAGVCSSDAEAAERIARAHNHNATVPTVIGTPAHCAALLRALAVEFGVDEIVFHDVSPLHADRVQSYTLLAEALAL